MSTALNVLVAPDSFKGSVTARRAAAALADGWLEARPHDHVRRLPLADGGEGTVFAVLNGRPDVHSFSQRFPEPGGRSKRVRSARLPNRALLVELASTCGFRHATREAARWSSTRALGAHLRPSLSFCNALLVGLGGSASTDGGTGALRALGARFLDASGRELPDGGAALHRLAAVDLDGLVPPPPGGVALLADVCAPLLGEHGAARVFGPQKGAAPEDVALFEAGLEKLQRLLGHPDGPGAGAAGGTAYGLQAAWGARIAPGAETVFDLVGLPRALAEADVVITGEGRFDAQSLIGKVVGRLLQLAADADRQVALVAGQVAQSPGCPYLSLAELAGSTTSAKKGPTRWLRLAGRQLAQRAGH